MGKEAIMETDFKNIAGMFKANTDIVTRAIADVEPDHWFKKPGDDSNHLTWVMGHLIVHRGRRGTTRRRRISFTRRDPKRVAGRVRQVVRGVKESAGRCLDAGSSEGSTEF